MQNVRDNFINIIVIAGLNEVFTRCKTDVNIFLKHQSDIDIERDLSLCSLYIPRLMTTVLNKILKLKHEGKVTKLQIYKALNGSEDLSDEKYANIYSIIEEVNKGDWKALEESNDVLILAEILFIWLDESVKYCISPLTVKELFIVEKEEFLNKSRFIDIILNSHKIEGFTLSKIYRYIKSTLKKYEWEILTFYVSFTKSIFPNESESEEVDEYMHMTEKMCIFLMGYNIDLLYENEKKNDINSEAPNEIYENVQRLILLTEFLQATFQKNEAQKYYESDSSKKLKIDIAKLSELEKVSKCDIKNLGTNNINLPSSPGGSEINWYRVYKTLKSYYENDNDKIEKRFISPIQTRNLQTDDFSLNLRSCEKVKDNLEPFESEVANDSDKSDEETENKKAFSQVENSQQKPWSTPSALNKNRSTLKLKYRFSMMNNRGSINSIKSYNKESKCKPESRFNSEYSNNVLVINNNK